MDALSDLAILGFAAWTVLYHIGLLSGVPTDALLGAWVVVFAATSVWWLARRTARPVHNAVAAMPRLSGGLVAGALLLAVVSGLLVSTGESRLWRISWVLGAAAALVALVAVLRSSADAPVEMTVRRSGGPVGTLVALGTALGLAAFSWAPPRGVGIESTPTWRYYLGPLTQARALTKKLSAGDVVLAPPTTMRAIALTTTRIHAVSPLLSYTGALHEPATQRRDRLLLAYLMQGGYPAPTVAHLRAALGSLSVGAVCVPRSWPVRAGLFRAAGYGNGQLIGHLICLRPESV